MQPRQALFISVMVTSCSGERSFLRFRIIKTELKGRKERLSTLSIRYIKSDELTQTNCNEFLDNFVT